MFRGPSWDDHLRVRFARPRPEGRLEPRRAKRKIISSGASYRLTLHPLPKKLQPCHPAEIGPLVTCRFFLPLPAFGRGWDRRPDHLTNMLGLADSG